MTGRRIINHWSVSGYTPNATDFEHYHFIIAGNGDVYHGDHKIEANDNTSDDDYAQHTGGGNTKSIGVAVSAMLGYESPKKVGKYPITKVQIEKLFELNAKLLFNEGFTKVTIENLKTHYQFGKENPKTSSVGKIDICFIPYYPKIKPDDCADFIREKTQWYLNKIVTGELNPRVTLKN